MKAMLLILSSLLVGTCAFADYQDAQDAYNRKDYAAALEELQPLAENGDAKAQYALGWMYERGHGVSADDQTALKWYRLAADREHTLAMSQLGGAYFRGSFGLDKDYETAFEWLMPAAERGHDEAQYNLGLMYEKGNGVTKDDQTAVKWYRLAAEQGHGNAQNNLGVMYAKGKGVAQNYIYSHVWWDFAATQKAENAAQNLYEVRKLMTPAEILTAQDLARECAAKNYKSCFPEEQSAKGALVFNVLAVEKTKISQPFKFGLNAPIEEREVMDGQSFLIVDLEFTNPNSFSVNESYGENRFSLLVGGVLSPSTAYVWSDANQTYLDGRDLSTIKEATGYWYKQPSGGTKLSGKQTRQMKIMFPILDASGNDVKIQAEGVTNKVKYKSRIPAGWDNVCVAKDDGTSSVAAFAVLKVGFLQSLGNTLHDDVFDQFVSEASNAHNMSSIVKTEFSGKLLKEGETKAQYFKRKGCDSYLELSVTPSIVGAQVISGGMHGKKHGRLHMAIVGEMINTSDNSTIWKDSYRHTCGFEVATPFEEMELLLEGSEEEKEEEAAKKSQCGRLAGKKLAGSFLEKM